MHTNQDNSIVIILFSAILQSDQVLSFFAFALASSNERHFRWVKELQKHNQHSDVTLEIVVVAAAVVLTFAFILLVAVCEEKKDFSMMFYQL